MYCRIANELRVLFWPWCLLMVTAIAPIFQLFRTDNSWEVLEAVGGIGFFGFATILSALSIQTQKQQCETRNENVSRSQLWLEKVLVLATAILCASVVACLAQTVLG